jgi:ribosomal protein L11 methyltransferase
MSVTKASYLVEEEREDDLVALLWEVGTLGVQVLAGDRPGSVRLEAYFDGPSTDRVPGEVGVGRFLGAEAVPPADWMAGWREAARPFPVGERLLLDPRDPEMGEAPWEPGRRTLRIPARAAFGTGSHESTRLVLELLERMDLAGKRVLDVGTGTGVLAFAALLLGARRAVGLDVDPAAPFHARANARLNELRPALLAGGVAALSPAARFDLALVNVVPEEIGSDLPSVVALLVPGGEAVLSGILADSGPRVLAEAAALGLAPVAERTAGEWVAYRVRTGAP